MSFIRRHTRVLLVGVTCAAAAAGAGAIATAGASTGSSAPAPSAPKGRLVRLAARAVHGDLVVRTKTGFATVTFDRGTVHSVSGRQLMITEGTPGAAYETVTVTIPTTARIRDNGQRATLEQVTAGQRVVVVTAPKRTLVVAHTPRAA